jgi:hypothetical protein
MFKKFNAQDPTPVNVGPWNFDHRFGFPLQTRDIHLSLSAIP